MRHAETNYNYPRKRLQGMLPSDKIHISDKGRQEAASKLGSFTLPDLLVMSPLLRCKQTAEAWADNDLTKIKSHINFMDGLKEVDEGFEIMRMLKQGLFNIWMYGNRNKSTQYQFIQATSG